VLVLQPKLSAKSICPFCHDGGLEEWSCPRCATSHHLECWEAHGGCSVHGCSTPIPQPHTPRPWLEYSFVAQGDDGERVEGQVGARDHREARRALQAAGLVVDRVWLDAPAGTETELDSPVRRRLRGFQFPLACLLALSLVCLSLVGGGIVPLILGVVAILLAVTHLE
jgi:hypothetical protein